MNSFFKKAETHMLTTRSHRFRPLAAVALAGGALLLGASPASAHVGIEESEQVAGSSTVLNFAVPHGCDGSPTTAIAIQIPESILSVTPNRNPYYDVAVETETLDTPVEGAHGEEVTERDAVVTYTAREPLPDGIRDVLGISLSIPDDAAGETIYFPVVQTCEQGETAWIEIPEDGVDPHSLESPAPAIHVVAAPDAPEDHVPQDHASGDQTAAPDTTDDDDSGTDALTIAAVVIAVLALGLGGAAFATARFGASKS